MTPRPASPAGPADAPGTPRSPDAPDAANAPYAVDIPYAAHEPGHWPDPNATLAELAGRLDAAVRDGDVLDSFLYAAGMVQAAEDRLAGTWTAPRRLARHLRDRSAPGAAAVSAALDRVAAGYARTPPAGRAVRWTAALAGAAEDLAALLLDTPPAAFPTPLHRRLRWLAAHADGDPVIRHLLGPAVLRPPSSFCSFDQYPADLAELARRFDLARPLPPERPLLVLGVRTSGSYLGPLLAAALRRSGHRRVRAATVRPGQAVLPGRGRELAGLLAAGAEVLLVDDPPVTGRSLAQVATTVRRTGFPADALSVLVALEGGDPPALAPFRVVPLPRDAWHVEELTSPPAIESLVRRTVPDAVHWPGLTVGPPVSAGRGLHRAVPVTGRPATGPPVQLLVETVGLGHLGRRAVQSATALHGLVPEVLALHNGLLVRHLAPGEALAPDRTAAPGRTAASDRTTAPGPPSTSDRTTAPDQLAALADPVAPDAAARYVAARERALAVPEDRTARLVGRGPTWEEAGRLFAPLFGRWSALLRPLLADPIARQLTYAESPYVVDGRTSGPRWAGERGRWLKTDWAEGAFSHLDLASYDAAWDLAGVAVTLAAQDRWADAEEVRAAFERLTGRRIGAARWCLAQLVQIRHGLTPWPDRSAQRRRALAQAVQGFLAEEYLHDLPPSPADGPGAGWCVLDLDGVLETDPLGFPAGSPLGMLALRALRAHGYRTVAATGRSLPELQDRCRAYGLAGGVAEYGAVLQPADAPPRPLAEPADRQLLLLVDELADTAADPLSRWTVRASRRHPDGRRSGLDRPTAERLAAATGYRVVPGEQQTDFLPPGVGKADGVRSLLAASGDPDAVPVLAVGDGVADLELLRWARHGLSPANAAPELRADATLMPSPYQAGLAEAVARLIGHPPGACPRCRAPRPSPENRALLALLALPEAGLPGMPRRLAHLATVRATVPPDRPRKPTPRSPR